MTATDYVKHILNYDVIKSSPHSIPDYTLVDETSFMLPGQAQIK